MSAARPVAAIASDGQPLVAASESNLSTPNSDRSKFVYSMWRLHDLVGLASVPLLRDGSVLNWVGQHLNRFILGDRLAHILPVEVPVEVGLKS